MRITEIDLQCLDIMWFAVDNNGNIFECTSAGCGNVPEYVCKSQEETDTLVKYFTEKAPVITTANLLIPKEDNDLVNDVTNLASKGIYCFDITDYENDSEYTCIAKPEKPANIKDFPKEIQVLLSDHLYDGNIQNSEIITVQHAY